MPSRYKRIVTKEIGKLERMLKVLLTPADGSIIASSYLEMVGSKGTATELARLLDIKGIPKKDHSALVEQYHQEKMKSKEKEKEKGDGDGEEK